MRKISMMMTLLTTMALSSFALADSGDGTLPVIRSINIDFQGGRLQRQLNIPDCINVGIKAADFKGRTRLQKSVSINNSKLVQDITVQKHHGVVDLQVNTINGNQILDSSLISVSEQEFHNTLRLGSEQVQQTIQLNGSHAGCVSK